MTALLKRLCYSAMKAYQKPFIITARWDAAHLPKHVMQKLISSMPRPTHASFVNNKLSGQLTIISLHMPKLYKLFGTLLWKEQGITK